MNFNHEHLIFTATILLSRLAVRAAGSPAARAVVGDVIAMDRHPVRADGALTALVALGIVTPEEGAARIQALLRSDDPEQVQILSLALGQLLIIPRLPSTLTDPV